KADDVDSIVAKLKDLGEVPFVIGKIEAGERKVVYNGVEW
ncbi:phosphoribosylformylglycinamidine cyclo-ligase, partial [Paenibacillus chitinolyticus]